MASGSANGIVNSVAVSDGRHDAATDNSGTDMCAKRRLRDCLTLLQTLSKDHNLAFAENEKQLKEMCR